MLLTMLLPNLGMGASPVVVSNTGPATDGTIRQGRFTATFTDSEIGGSRPYDAAFYGTVTRDP